MNDDLKKQQNQNNNILMNIKSKHVLKKIMENLDYLKFLKLIYKNKCILNKLGKNINAYKEYLETEIEIEIAENKYGKFINYLEDEESFYHIYFDDNKEETKRNEITENDKIKNIKIKIDYDCKFFSGLFMSCECIKKIKFTKFNRKDIHDMSSMFNSCSSLEELDISLIKTDKVESMNEMFKDCSLLQNVDVSKFNTSNVKNMEGMFNGCIILEELNVNNFDTNNVTSMQAMFKDCKCIGKLDLSNFKTENVTNMSYMFSGCEHLQILKINNFNTKNVK